MSDIAGIYQITNLVNKKIYIGRSVNLHNRWVQHTKNAADGFMFPLHCAIRKYGVSNFKFEVLQIALAEDLPDLENLHIVSAGAYDRSKGYNVGGTKGGWPSKAELSLMHPDLRSKWIAHYGNSAKKGADSLRNKRNDAEFEIAYLKIMSNAGVRREKIISDKRLVDSEYDSKIKKLRSIATANRVEGYQKTAGEKFSEKFKSDSDFKVKISENRRKAQKASAQARGKNLWFERSIATHMRSLGLSLNEIAAEVGKSAAWVCLELQKKVRHVVVS